MDPFVLALGALFRGPGSKAAAYRRPGVADQPIRTIRTSATVDMQVGDKLIMAGSTMIQIQRSDIPSPLAGDVIDDGEPFAIIGRPTLDVEQITWNCEAGPA